MSCLPDMGKGDGDRISGSIITIGKFTFCELFFEEKEKFAGGT